MRIPIYKLPILLGDESLLKFEELIRLVYDKEYEDKQNFLYPVISYKGDDGYYGKYYRYNKTLEDRNICAVVHKFEYNDGVLIAQIKPIVSNFFPYSEDNSFTPYLCPLGIVDDKNNVTDIIAFQICHL